MGLPTTCFDLLRLRKLLMNRVMSLSSLSSELLDEVDDNVRRRVRLCANPRIGWLDPG
jgi:hypothetical protein